MNQPTDEADEREQLERRAKVVRERLARRLDALDQRRQDLEAVVSNVASSAKRVLPAIVGVASAVVIVGVAVRARRKRRRHERFQQAVSLLLEPPAAPIPPRPNPLKEGLKQAALGILLRVARRVAERMLERALTEAPELPEAARSAAE